MDWNRVEGNWKQFKGAAKEKWGKLTDDDLNVIEGRREQLEGKLQQRYGFAKVGDYLFPVGQTQDHEFIFRRDAGAT